MKKRVAIVVCGVNNHIILINKLKARGYHTILVDGTPNPAAKDSADEFCQIDIFDFDGIKQFACERHADLIINACYEHINAGICKIAMELGLPHPYSYETAIAISNKVEMKTRMNANDIHTTDFVIVTSPDQINDSLNLKMPVYVKSCVGSGSNAVYRAVDINSVRMYVEKALQKYPGAEVIIEEEAKGAEYNVYCFPEDGEPNVLQIARRYTDNLAEDHVTKLIATLAPANISEKAEQEIKETAKKISSAFGLNNVPMFMQIMVDGDHINVIEFAGRMAGGFGYESILQSTGIDLFEATINAFLRIPNHLSFHKTDEFITVSHLYGNPCVFGEVVGAQKLLEDGTAAAFLFPRKRGTEISKGFANRSLVGFVINKDRTVQGLITKIEKTFNSLKVLDTNGNDVLNRELLLTEERLVK